MMLTTAPTAAPSERPSLPREASRPSFVRVLRAVTARELRQNWGFLALAMVVAGFIICLTQWLRTGENPLHNWEYGDYNILLSSGVQSAIVIGCMFVGLLLGLLQPL